MDGKGAWPQRVSQRSCTLPSTGGLQAFREETRLLGGAQEEAPPSFRGALSHTLSTDLKAWGPERPYSLSGRGGCDLRWLLFLSGPHHTLQEVALRDQVFSIHISPFDTKPLPLSSEGSQQSLGRMGRGGQATGRKRLTSPKLC